MYSSIVYYRLYRIAFALVCLLDMARI